MRKRLLAASTVVGGILLSILCVSRAAAIEPGDALNVALTGQITHHTAADIDAERAHVFDTLQHTEDLAEMYKVPGFHKQLEGINGGGDRWYTDGALWVGVIKENFAGGGDLATGSDMDW